MATLPEQEAARTSKDASEDLHPKLRVGTGWDLVTSLEGEICGKSFVVTPAEAEGLSAVGVLAAGLTKTIPERGSVDFSDRPVVHHVRFSPETVLAPDLECVFIAGSHQDAVDQTLVAHHARAWTGKPVVALQDKVVSDSLGRVAWPSQELLSASKHAFREPEGDSQGPLSLLLGAFEAVSRGTDREVAPLELSGKKDAPDLILTAGAWFDLLREPCSETCALGAIQMLRPFPAEALRSRLEGRNNVYIALPSGAAVFDEIAAAVEEVAGTLETAIHRLELPAQDLSLDRLLEAINSSADRPLVKEPRRRQAFNLGVSPGASWGEAVLFETLSRDEAGTRIDRSSRILSHPLVAEFRGNRDSEELDLLLLLQVERIDSTIPLERLKSSGILLLGGGEHPAEAWRRLGSTGRQLVSDRKIELRWIPSAYLGSLAPEQAGRILEATLRETAAGETAHSASDLPKAEKLDPDTLSATLESNPDFIVTGSLPAMEPPSEEADEKWHSAALDFHFSSGAGNSPLSALPLTPAALMPLRDSGALTSGYPLVASEEGIIPLASFLKQTLDRMAEEGEDVSVLKRHVGGLTDLLARSAASELSFEEIVETAFLKAGDFFDLSSEGLTKLSRELEALRPALSLDAAFISLEESAYLSLFDHAVLRCRREYRRARVSEIEKELIQLDNLIRSDRELSSEYSTPEAIDSSMGGGGAFIDAASLSSALPAKKGSVGLNESRRRRIAQARETLLAYKEELAQLPPYFLIGSDDSRDVSALKGKSLTHSDPFGIAQGLQKGLQNRAVEAARASRIARLEIGSDYDESIHDARLANFSADACDEAELLSTPPVVVCETAENLADQGLTAFTRLLRSNQPVYVLVVTSDVGDDREAGKEAFEKAGIDLGHLAIAHREAFVLQTLLTHPTSLYEGFGKMLNRLRPGVAVVGMVPAETSTTVLESSALAHFAHSLPIFEYDPEGGDAWADRFSLSSNPQAERAFPEVVLEHITTAGGKGQLKEKLTLAHRLAVEPGFREHFRVLEPVEGDGLIELGQHLESDGESQGTVPFIWVLTENLTLRRAIVTREVVQAARLRQRAWRTLQELAGLNNAYVTQAVQTARSEAESTAKADREGELEKARAEGAASAIDRLVKVLMNSEALRDVPSGSPSLETVLPAAGERKETEAAPTEEKRGEAPPSQVEAPAEEPSEMLEDSYIESYLCTSCNDCINLNPRMFKYNQDNQAYIADVEAGTYLELVKAAEACPANCIHPGAPRPGDSTATDEVIQRAKAYQ